MPPRDIGLIALVILAWGSNFTAMKLALEEVPPFLMVRDKQGEGLMVPPGGGTPLNKDYMLRFLSSCLLSAYDCPVCLEHLSMTDPTDPGDTFAPGTPNSFPCGHLVCQPCTARLFPVPPRGITSGGITCPVCRASWPHFQARDNGAGGANIMEQFTS